MRGVMERTGKQISFTAVSKDCQYWSWSDIGWQTVPRRHPATATTRSSTVDSRVRRRSLAAWMTTTEDGSGWNQRRTGCGRKDTVQCRTVKLAFHGADTDTDTDTDLFADILARIVARMSACRSACHRNNFNRACRTCRRVSSRGCPCACRCRCRRRRIPA